MNREEFTNYILENYICAADNPWKKNPDYTVFRHPNNKKWFALIMNIPKSYLGLSEEGSIDIANMKCDPMLIGSLLQEEGFYRAYHMNKEHWITVALDGNAADDEIKTVLDMSFEATEMKRVNLALIEHSK